jgi:chromate transport protein ChrA
MHDHEHSHSALQAIAWPVYLAGVLTALLPMVDLLASVWPPRLGQVEWRFGTLGLLSGFTLSPLLGLVMCMAAAAVLEHRIVQRVLAVFALIGAVKMLAIVVIFSLDWLQFRAAAPAEARLGMDVGSAKAVIKHALVAVSFIWLGIAGWRAGRREHRARRSTPPPLVREAAQP